MRKSLSLALLLILLVAIAVPMTAFAQSGDGVISTLGIVSEDVVAIRAEANIGAEALITVEDGETVSVLGVDGIWANVAYTDADGVVTEGFAFAADFSILELSVIGSFSSNSAVAVRTDPEIFSDVVATEESGALAFVYDVTEDGTFSFVMTEAGDMGWAFTENIVPFQYADEGTVNENRVLFRSEADSSSTDTIIRPLNSGETVLVLDVTSDYQWFEVLVDGQLGFVSSAFVDTDAVDLTIAGIAADAGFENLLAAVGAADPAVAAALTGDGPLTVFAPTDAAFEALGEDTLNAVLADQEQVTNILLYHVIEGAFLSTDVVAAAGDDGELVVPSLLEGDSLTITIDEEGNVFVDGVQVEAFDIQASNGVIHVIGGVLLPDGE